MVASASHRRVSDKEAFYFFLRRTLAFFLRLKDYFQTNRMHPRAFNSGTSFFFVKNGCEKNEDFTGNTQNNYGGEIC